MSRPHVLVVGAGAFGGWSALQLLRAGARVTLVDAAGPANAKASSGDDTRVIRHTYDERLLVDLVARSIGLWKEHAQRWDSPLYEACGVLWMTGDDDAYERAAVGHMSAAGVPFERLDPAAVAARFPMFNAEGARWAIHEPEAGFLRARLACETVVRGFQREGGEYRQVRARPGAMRGSEMEAVELDGGERLVADRYVFACGSWMGTLFPEQLGHVIRPTRQEVFYFAPTPAVTSLPVWGDHGADFWYSIPELSAGRIKMANDTWGPPFDPETGDRSPSEAGAAAARAHLEFRVPAMRGARLIEGRVCSYETTPDNRFVVDRLPGVGNAWIAGGGSGNGFKFGPALGEIVAGMVMHGTPPLPLFAVGRFAAK